MPKRSSKPPADPNVAAHEAVRRLTWADEDVEPTDEERKAIARILGSRGGKKGGPARAAKLTRAQRSEIARKAARQRWANKDTK